MSRVIPRPLYQARVARPPMYGLSPEPPPLLPHPESLSSTHALTLILTILLLILFFVGFFSIYFCRCFMENLMSILNARGRNPIGTPVNPSNPDPPGLDPTVIESFPAFDYSSVKDYRPANYGLECAICLSEFQEDDVIRLIPECCHVFHKDCIDLWLASHKSCPVCRRGLDPETLPEPDDGPDPSPIRLHSDIEARGPGDDGPSCSITVKEDSGSPPRRMALFAEGRFSRSHSTGHSIVRTAGAAAGVAGEDKYTLRLPEHVIKETIKRGHVQTVSCTTFGEMSSQGRSCFGEISGHYNRSCTDINVNH